MEGMCLMVADDTVLNTALRQLPVDLVSLFFTSPESLDLNGHLYSALKAVSHCLVQHY